MRQPLTGRERVVGGLCFVFGLAVMGWVGYLLLGLLGVLLSAL